MSASTHNTSPLASLDYSILQQCMHCGLCLPSCPTYAETKVERHSPRGRIALMRAIADGEMEVNRAFGEEMNYCLGCLACTSACPAGVDFATMLETARTEVEQKGVLKNPARSLIREFTLRFLFTRPRALRLAGRLLRFWQVSGLQNLVRHSGLLNLLPERWRDLEKQTPVVRDRFSHELIQPLERPAETPRHRVLVLTGCVQDLVFSDVNRATVDVLLANGCEVHTPPGQSCCGSLHAHNGDRETAQLLARRQLDAIHPADYDAILSNAGGCGSHLRHYGHLLADDPAYAERARLWSARLRDINEWLVEIGFRAPSASSKDTAPATVTYHDSCHLCHSQKIRSQPREILRAASGQTLVECREADWCCGSAGTYSLTHPETATRLRDRKLDHLQATGASTIATCNPGCLLQIENGLKARNLQQTRVVHPVVLLAEAYRREREAGQD